MLALITIFSVWISAFGDVYLNNPRGSNNKLSEQSNNVQNDNRLFDSQNNAAAGYQVGDDCRPVCQNGNRDYDASKEGAMQGMMTFYQGSELYLEWHAQHGCGLGHPNLHCQMILQYMSEGDNPNLRDGTKRGNQNTAGGRQEPPDTEEARDPTLGQHEPVKFYQDCRARERNKGLYTADQNVNNNRGATATRQNPNGNANANQRHGLECPEERDYYPYWHPTPWHDIAIFTDEPLERCAYYQGESQNRRAKGLCSEPAHNNPASCQQAGAEWSEQAAFDEPAPECVGGIQSRDNHNGNVRNGRPMYYVWHVPHHVQGRTVLRLRYNITTLDLEPSAVAAGVDDEASTGTTGDTTDSAKTQDAFFIDERFNDRNPSQRRRSIFRPGRPVVSNDPKADWLGLGSDEKPRVLQVQLNTNQVARTFEDRTHTFMVQARPSTVPAGARIVNYNVRGRRGNIVQVYPSVEYDFVPQELTVEAGTFVHFQWVGSDANPKGNAGNGRQGTDRSNLVQVAARGENLPLPIEQHTLFFDAQADPLNEEGRAIADRFAYLDQDKLVTCDVEEDDNQAVDNCKQLNGASAYFNGGVIELTQVGTHHVASTRNNDFSNRSQKATIIVTPKPWTWLQIALLSLGVALALSSGVYLAAACYATLEPTSWLFSSRYRPRVLRFCLPNQVYQRKLEERRSFHRKRKEHLAALVAADDAQEFLAVGKALDADDSEAGDRARPGRRSGDRSRPASKKASVAPLESSSLSCLRSCRYCGFGEQRMALLLYFIMNVFAFAIGFLSHLGMGFEGSLAYPFAKGCGYMLDLNFAFLVLPTLKSLQTALRGAGSTREWIPIDDPISFHIAMGFLTMLGSAGHVVSHIVHMWRIATAPPIQQDPLELWDLTPSERMSGMRIWDQCLNLNNRCAAVTGIILVLLMVLMTLTALPCARRGTNCCTRRLGGYNLFRRVHSAWKLIYVLLLLHAPQRLWIWLVFPAILLAVDRVFLANRQRPYVALRQVNAPRLLAQRTADIFRKYDRDGDGALSRAEVLDFCRLELAFTLPEPNLERIFRQLLPLGAAGLPPAALQRLRSALGIARHEARMALRGLDPEERQQKEAEAGTLLEARSRGRAEAAAATLGQLRDAKDSVSGTLAATEQACETLASAADGTAEELLQKVQAAEVALGSARAGVTDFQQKRQCLQRDVISAQGSLEEMRPELKSMGSCGKVFCERLQKAEEIVSKSRCLAEDKASEEREKQRLDVANKLRGCIESLGGKVVDLFHVISKGSGETVTIGDIHKFLAENNCELQLELLNRVFEGGLQAAAEETKKEADNEEAGDARATDTPDRAGQARHISSTAVEGTGDLQPEGEEKCNGVPENKDKEGEAVAEADRNGSLVSAPPEQGQGSTEGRADGDETQPEGACETDGAPRIDRDNFMRLVRIFWKVTREVPLSEAPGAGAPIRNLDAGEVVEVLQGPTPGSDGDLRLRACALRDGAQGWASVSDQGGAFMVPGVSKLRVVHPVPLTEDLKDMLGTTPLRQLEKGEVLELVDWARTSKSALGVSRIRVRAPGAGIVGWATATDGDGSHSLEAV